VNDRDGKLAQGRRFDRVSFWFHRTHVSII
jgi:hypothetical protein